MLGKRFIGLVYVDGEHFTHPNRIMGVAEISRNKTLSELRKNVKETLANSYINNHNIELRICVPLTKNTEIIKY